jgi:hypothetical protein
MAMSHPRHGAPALLLGGFAAFLAAIAYLIASSLARPKVTSFAPTPLSHARPAGDGAREDTVTVDASDSRAWRFFDFARGSIVAPPDTAGWDLAIRRYHVIVQDAIADLGKTTFDRVSRAPSHGYAANSVGRDTTNAAVAHWYRYSFLTHRLEPSGHVYVVRTRTGGYAKMEILSYYCTGAEPEPGCVTFRYVSPIPGPVAAVTSAGR